MGWGPQEPNAQAAQTFIISPTFLTYILSFSLIWYFKKYLLAFATIRLLEQKVQKAIRLWHVNTNFAHAGCPSYPDADSATHDPRLFFFRLVFRWRWLLQLFNAALPCVWAFVGSINRTKKSSAGGGQGAKTNPQSAISPDVMTLWARQQLIIFSSGCKMNKLDGCESIKFHQAAFLFFCSD